jgi:hypothetical protein
MASIARAIERSPIAVAGWARCMLRRRRELLDLPAGYDLADLAILDWIAAEAVRAGRTCLPL